MPLEYLRETRTVERERERERWLRGESGSGMGKLGKCVVRKGGDRVRQPLGAPNDEAPSLRNHFNFPQLSVSCGGWVLLPFLFLFWFFSISCDNFNNLLANAIGFFIFFL